MPLKHSDDTAEGAHLARTDRLHVSFSGCRRTWSSSWKKRLTVASSPTSATTISPSAPVPASHTGVTLEMPAFFIESPDAQDVLAVLAARELRHRT